MRHAIVAALVALGLSAYAQEGELLAPRIRVPGESAVDNQLTISATFLEGLGMTKDDLASVTDQVKKLNEKRADLIKQLADAKNELAAAQKKVNAAITDLDQQKTTLDEFIQQRLPADQRADYAVRSQLQPVIDWLKLTKEQADQLMAKERELLAKDPRAELSKAARALQARSAGEPIPTDQRKQYIDLLKQVASFNQTWLSNIESVLTDEQKTVWRTRYRRTLYPIGIGGAAPAPAANM